jgi:DNA repair protein RadC
METQTLLPAATTNNLSDVELLALTLGHMSMRRAARLLARFHDLDGIATAPVGDFELERMTARRAMQLQAALELGRRSLARPLRRGVSITMPNHVAEMLGPRMVALEQEELHALAVDTRNRVVSHYVAARGSCDEVAINPRDVFRQALRDNCVGVFVVHNHPSGDPAPSRDDETLTRRLEEAGRIVGVRLLDHIIVARGGHFSFMSAGALERQEFGH